MNASPDDLIDPSGDFFDAEKAFRVMMQNEKPGGHGDRAHAVAAVELALWDLNAKLASLPAWKLIAAKFGVSPVQRMPVYAAGGYYYPQATLGRLKDEMKGYAEQGYTSFKMKIGGATLAQDMTRIEAALSVIGKSGTPRRRRERALRYADRTRLRKGHGRLRSRLVRRARRPAGLSFDE